MAAAETVSQAWQRSLNAIIRAHKEQFNAIARRSSLVAWSWL
jgi:hypothetical protein